MILATLYLLLFFSCVIGTRTAHQDYISVFQLDARDRSPIKIVEENAAVAYLGDTFDISDFYSLGKGSDSIVNFIDEQKDLIEGGSSEKPKMIVLVNGAEEPETFIENRIPSFKVQGKAGSLTHGIFSKFPRQFMALRSKDYNLDALTDEMKLLYLKGENSDKLIRHFHFFNENLISIWKNFKSNVIGSFKGTADEEIVVSRGSKLDMSTLNVINDRLFINELSQLVHLNQEEAKKGNLIFFNSNSLLSIHRMIGSESSTYKFARKVLSNFLIKLQDKYEIIVVSIPVGTAQPYHSNISKRNKELADLFKISDYSKRSVTSNSCFGSEEACQASTSNCNSHGVCSKVKAKCWTCLCSPTFNKTTSKTTKWSGTDCSKKDISVEANLFLWSLLALAIFFVGGIKLLIDVGNEPLPGVLDAATSSKKSS
ncbi:uncharacterized protein PRCAT00000596001 [Priceomyces carsonii]|uniref:uncharacterized protein n=1 Tax=Priceomyces carsonii TaxID=28549 RepID=UPI002EDB2F9D|nr:unnamed protein product [Priceomyces carsonii]